MKSLNPEWNYKIEYVILYPPLVSSIKIDLCTQDENTLEEKVIASEFLSIYDISNYLKDDCEYLPTYGPRYIDLYSLDTRTKIKNKTESSTDDLSQLDDSTQCDNFHYVARLFFSIESNREVKHDTTEPKSTKLILQAVQKGNSISYSMNGFKNEFILFLVLDEVTMIDPKYKDGLLSFQLCFGNRC